MTIILTIAFLLIVAFDLFMVTPFGVFWTMSNIDDGKPCYGIIIAFATAIPAVIIGAVLGIIH